MTISKKLKSRSESRSTLEYVYRGEKSHPVLDKKGKLLLDNARHIGGQLSTPDPFTYGQDSKPKAVNIDELAVELDLQVTKYRGLGTGKNLIQHYVVSLAPGETLSDSTWRKVVKTFMDEMGYGNDTLYTSCVHTEKDHEHAHIVACRVRHNGKLVSDKNDYSKAVTASRKIEKVFGLKIVPNPDETMGVEPTRKDIELDRKGIKILSEDPAIIIRKRISSILDATNRLPEMTMSDFVEKLKGQGIQVKIKLNKEDEPIGINYSLDSKLWISGSKIKKTRTTWKALLEKEKIDYNPSRDNVVLGIMNDKSDNIAITQVIKPLAPEICEMSFFVKLTKKQKSQLQKHNVIAVYRHETENDIYALLNFKFHNKPDYNLDDLVAVIQALISLLINLLGMIFGCVLPASVNESNYYEINKPDVKYDFDILISDKLDEIVKVLQSELDFIDEESIKNKINKNNDNVESESSSKHSNKHGCNVFESGSELLHDIS